MTARLIEIFLPESEVERLESILARHSRRFWRETVPGRAEKYTCIVQQRYTERLLGDLQAAYGDNPDFTARISRLEAVIPPVLETADTELPAPDELRPPTAIERFFSRDRISTTELYEDIEESLHITPTFLLTVFLSSVIAALGMRSGQTAVVIGAMVIAPLLGPTMGIAIAATIGDPRRGAKAATALCVGSTVAILAGALVGALVDIDLTVSELRNRSLVQPADIALALACGAAGVLAMSKAASLSLVGVMIAVALVPPLAATGIFLGIGEWVLAANALFLFTINFVCLNVAGIVMFLVEGLPPKSWRVTTGLLSAWTAILIVLALVAAGRLVFGLGTLERIGSLMVSG
ncbi:TIGR00341 family protein [Erythrobacter sp. JK5]|uniref:TIGR00341 family protein n=1 Tax=Erythrobacter sp. JK5 TaxID=2829500 RepID=UPI001BACAD49|nr:TIGR00341 family protein [Erythrobacter sp. JK5]QUL38837.1 TIGR00341 family protein [Erythrobacter sp. JK5]